MNGIQCPECGAAEVPDQASSCPDCGYPILTLSGFSIRERLRESAAKQAAETNADQGVSKGKKIKAKLSRAKNALSKKGKTKKSLEEVVLPQISQLPAEEQEVQDVPPSEMAMDEQIEDQDQPSEEIEEVAAVQEELEPIPNEVPADPRPLSTSILHLETFRPEQQEQDSIEPQVRVDRITLAAEEEEPLEKVEAPAALARVEPLDMEPTQEEESIKTDPDQEEGSALVLNEDRNEPIPPARFYFSAAGTSPSAEISQCYECGEDVDPNANFCPYCKASLLGRFCPGCRRLVAGNTSFCAYCGTAATSVAKPPRSSATVVAVLMIVFTGIAIYFAKDFIFEDPTLNKNMTVVNRQKSPAQVPENIPALTKPAENSSPVKKIDERQSEPQPNKDGLIETTINENGSVQQESIQEQQPSVASENENKQSSQKPAHVIEKPKTSTPRPTVSQPAGLNTTSIAGIPTYKHRDPSLATYLNFVGSRLIRQRRYEEAVPILKKSVSYFPDNTKEIAYAYALFNLGHALRMSGRAHEAIPVLEARMKINNQRETVRRELAAARVAALGAPLQP